jgi:hypothetical protein
MDENRQSSIPGTIQRRGSIGRKTEAWRTHQGRNLGRGMDGGDDVLGMADGGGEVGWELAVAMFSRLQQLLKGRMGRRGAGARLL